MRTLLLFGFVILCMSVFAQTPATKYEDPEKLIKDLYQKVSTKAGEEVDWNQVKSLFIDEAIILLRTKPDQSTQFTVEGFIQDFKSFYANSAAKDNGFVENILRMESTIYKDMAFISTVYEALIPGISKAPTRGIDFWLLQKFDDHWKVVSVTNELIAPAEDLPKF